MRAKSPSQPKALPFLFLTELWERFGFYIVQGLLVLYITEYFGFTDSESYTILGVFTAFAYISPLAGGYLANRFLGYRTSIVWGGLFLILGYTLLALPYPHVLFYPGLATIIIGNGLFKPNISSLLGLQYEVDDPRRDSGFTIFYVGINIGASLAGLSSGYIKNYFGWRMSFALAALGLAIGLATFLYGLRYIKGDESSNRPKFLAKYQFLLYCFLAIIGMNFLLEVRILSDWLLPCVGILLLIFLVVITWQQNADYRKKMFVLNILILSSIIFWTLFLQIFYSANLFVDRLVDKHLFGIPLTTTVFYASEGIFIILLGPFFAWSWDVLGHHNKNPTPITKFCLGILFAGLGFLLLGISTQFLNQNELINPIWVFASYLLITIGELFLSPIGLSAVTMLAPPHLIGMMMGIWFVASGFGGIFAGTIAKIASIPSNAVTPYAKLAIYHKAFFDYAYLAFFFAIILFFIRLGVNRFLKEN